MVLYTLNSFQCRMQWHKQGDYLCVKINLWATKSKKV